MKLLFGIVVGLLLGWVASTDATQTCDFYGRCQDIQPPGNWHPQSESQREQYDLMLKQQLNQWLLNQNRHPPC